ncbi:MAG: hypothetical protein M0D57_09065 [Sphingobacteriales bacterium JAD_PAG50586_3]|nr:MAG: hypothetical protein M0D57_09065 [Sphingobacteriales bacterium JAD_PAG50586_3]
MTGRNCGPANIEEARKKFITAKRLGFYNSRIRKRASEGLSRYQLIKGDTAEATNILEKLIGNAVNTNIKAGRFERISKTKKQQWAKYGAATGIS